VVLLSDHGEAFHFSEPEWTVVNLPGVRIDTPGWHGTNVLSEAQNKVLLAFRGYGKARLPIAGEKLDEPTVSLVDIFPTLADWAGNWSHVRAFDVDGISVYPFIFGMPTHQLAARAISLESGFVVDELLGDEFDPGDLSKRYAVYYDVSRNGRLEMKDDLIPMLMSRKQRAAAVGHWILAGMPALGNERKSRSFYLGNLLTHEAWDVRLGGLPSEAPTFALKEVLCEQFRKVRNVTADNLPDLCDAEMQLNLLAE
jgi:hypothetical protein